MAQQNSISVGYGRQLNPQNTTDRLSEVVILSWQRDRIILSPDKGIG